MKKILAIALAVLMLASLTACGESAGSDTYTVGICQLLTHPALDAATQGFKDALVAELGEGAVTFKDADAGGEYNNCATIVDGFVAEGVDLILANATAPLQAAKAATATIPILGTSVTDYATALNIANWNGTVGGNVSGTSDLAPLDQQAAMIQELFPNAKTVGLLFCSAEPNSVYQIEQMKTHLEGMGYTCAEYAFTDVNDLASVTQTACDSSGIPIQFYCFTSTYGHRSYQTAAPVVTNLQVHIIQK